MIFKADVKTIKFLVVFKDNVEFFQIFSLVPCAN